MRPCLFPILRNLDLHPSETFVTMLSVTYYSLALFAACFTSTSALVISHPGTLARSLITRQDIPANLGCAPVQALLPDASSASMDDSRSLFGLPGVLNFRRQNLDCQGTCTNGGYQYSAVADNGAECICSYTLDAKQLVTPDSDGSCPDGNLSVIDNNVLAPLTATDISVPTSTNPISPDTSGATSTDTAVLSPTSSTDTGVPMSAPSTPSVTDTSVPSSSSDTDTALTSATVSSDTSSPSATSAATDVSSSVTPATTPAPTNSFGSTTLALSISDADATSFLLSITVLGGSTTSAPSDALTATTAPSSTSSVTSTPTDISIASSSFSDTSVPASASSDISFPTPTDTSIPTPTSTSVLTPTDTSASTPSTNDSNSSTDTATSTPTTSTPSTTTSTHVPRYTNLGCYAEPLPHDPTTRSLANYTTGSISNLTVQGCISTCYHLGWMLAGVEDGDQCYCSDGIYNGGSPAPFGNCSFPCSGNATESCGGDFLFNLYVEVAYLRTFFAMMPEALTAPSRWSRRSQGSSYPYYFNQ